MQMLYQWEIAREAVDDVTAGFFEIRPAAKETRAIAERLFRGALRAREMSDARISAAARWRLDRLAAVERGILRLAIYELAHERETPSAVILNEAVELAKRFGEADSGAFVNGVLDSIRRELREGDEPSMLPQAASRHDDGSGRTDGKKR
ncbi:MAG: transcription antitermination factor NusB [Vicinamibacteria bacterium]|nr:transcription antitermination factor NusB [Vicinamibacteria bacterium]